MKIHILFYINLILFSVYMIIYYNSIGINRLLILFCMIIHYYNTYHFTLKDRYSFKDLKRIMGK